MSSNISLNIAVAEAKRFLERATALIVAEKAGGSYHPIESGAARRSSLDLSRALAAFRKPRW